MRTFTNPMQGRAPTSRGSEPSDLSADVAYDYRRKVGAYVRDARLAAGYTQEEVAKHLGMGHAAISAVELGRSTISPERYQALASLFNLDQKEFGEFLLKHTNPWLYEMIFPERTDRRLKRDLKTIPHRVKSVGHS